jgi:hypothetical protein
MVGELEESVNMVPSTRWEDIVASKTCEEELRSNADLRKVLPGVESIVEDCKMKIAELAFAHLPVTLPKNELFAIVAYTHDTGMGKESNLYFQVNKQLRKRKPADRQELVRVWGTYMHFTLKAMQKLPDYKGVVYRGYPDKKTAIEQYQLGRPIQWGGFTSTSTSFDATRGFTDAASGVIFKITVSSGKDVNAYSFFPCENEILLSPKHRFIVSSEPYEKSGYTVLDMVQQKGSAWIS